MTQAKTVNQVAYVAVVFAVRVRVVLVEDWVFEANVGDARRVGIFLLGVFKAVGDVAC